MASAALPQSQRWTIGGFRYVAAAANVVREGARRSKYKCALGARMPLTRREAIIGCGGALVLLAGRQAVAQATYPSKPIKMIVPYPAGGTTDFLGRLVADQLKIGLGATVIVENKPGAGTALGAELVAKAEPDGYTLLMATSTTLAINKALYKTLPYDPVKDFTPIALVAGVPFALVVNPSLPVKTLSEFIAYAKSKPGLAAMAVRSISAPKCSRRPRGSISATCRIAAACARCSM
jgi:tripartite-type tricarboxylate transporter receptor subunit TctC